MDRHWKAAGVNLDRLLTKVDIPEDAPLHHTETQDHGLSNALDNKLISLCKNAISDGQAVQFDHEIRNVNRSVGTMLSGEVARAYGHEGLPSDTIQNQSHWRSRPKFCSLAGSWNYFRFVRRRQRLRWERSFRRPRDRKTTRRCGT